MASPPGQQPQSGQQPPASPPQPPHQQESTPMMAWILAAGLFLIALVAIAATIWIKSSLVNSQSPTATVIAILFAAIGVLTSIVGVLFSVLLYFFPNGPWFKPPAWLISIYGNSRLVKFINFGIPIIGIIVIIGILVSPYPAPTPNPGLTPHPTSTLIPTPTPTPRTGKSTDPSAPFAVYPNYDPSGYVGDIGDLRVTEETGLVHFVYTTNRKGPHEWEWKYLDDGTLNPNPCKFAGVLYLNPPNDWGRKDPHGGFDLRGRKTLTWKARSLSGPVYVKFVIGGVTWQWDGQTHTKVAVPYPDSMPWTPLGIPKLTSTWQTFTYDLSALPPDDLRAVVAGFGWEISWDNALQGTGSEQPQTFIIEIQDIFYQ
jgi:hypothetical protein